MAILKNAKHERFAQELAQGKSADEAYILAGYSEHRSNAARLSANERVRSRVEEILSKAAQKVGVTVERVLSELAKIGFSDIRKVIAWRGNVTVIGTDPDTDEPQTRAFNEVALTDSDKIDDATAAAIAEVSQTKDGAMKVKLYDKKGALELLGRHLGMFKDKVELTGKDGQPLPVERTVIILPANARDQTAARAADDVPLKPS